MFSFRFSVFVLLIALTAVSAMNWRSQIQTQQKLDAISAALAARPVETTPVEESPRVAHEPSLIPRELNPNWYPPYIIEAPDQLMVEVVVKNPKTGKTDRLPDQPISGQFLVRPDGTVGLGLWGSVSVASLTLEQASKAIRDHIARVRPQELNAENIMVIVDVLAYNSKKYYVIINQEKEGEQVLAFPLTGSETVLDAIGHVSGSPSITSKSSIRIVRINNGKAYEVLPVDWRGITQEGITTTNYAIRAGDRIYVDHKSQ